MKELARHYASIGSIALLVFFTNLGAARLWDRDEPRNAGCAEEMLRRGDWLVPVFNGELRDAKPVLLYWLIISAYSIFDVNEFAARFWSALLAVGTTLATYHIGRRLFNPQVALWGAIILATSFMFDVAGRAATPDSVLIFCGTVALLIFVLGSFPRPLENDQAGTLPNSDSDGFCFPRRQLFVVPMYAMMGLGILAKGPVGLVLPMAIIGMFLLIVRLPGRHETVSRETLRHHALPAIIPRDWRSAMMVVMCAVLICGIATLWGVTGVLVLALVAAATLSAAGHFGWLRILAPFAPRHFLRTCWSMRPITAVTVALSIALPWFVAVGIKTDGDFLRGFFLEQHLGRATTVLEHHSGSPLYYPIAILAGFFPWSVFAGPSLIELVQHLRRLDRYTFANLFLACWVGVYVGIFTLVQTKLPSYITPCYPALALATGQFIVHWRRGTTRVPPIWPQVSIVCLAIVGATAVVAFPFAARIFLPGDEWLGIVGLIPLLSGLGALLLRGHRQPCWASCVVAGAAVVQAVVLFGFVAPQISRHQQHHILFETIAQRSSNPSIGAFGCMESTWVVDAHRPIRNLSLALDKHTNQEIRSSDQGCQDWARKADVDVSVFVADNPEPFIITTEQHLPALQTQLTADFKILSEVPYFLKRHRLILLGRMTDTPRTANRSAPSQHQ